VLPVKFAAKGPTAQPRCARKETLSLPTSLSFSRKYFNFFLIFHKQRTHFVPYSSSLLLLPPSPPVSFRDASGCFSPSAITPANGIRCMKFAYATRRPRGGQWRIPLQKRRYESVIGNSRARARIITYLALHSTLSLSGTLCISVLASLTFLSRTRYRHSCSVIIVYEYFALIVRAMSVRLASIGLSLMNNNRSLNFISMWFLRVVHCLHRRSRRLSDRWIMCKVIGKLSSHHATRWGDTINLPLSSLNAPLPPSFFITSIALGERTDNGDRHLVTSGDPAKPLILCGGFA